MKRMICILLILAMLLPLTGCAEKQPEAKKPVTFYYCRRSPVYGAEDGLIAGEIRESAGYEDNFLGLLNRYISGPLHPDLVRPFPFAARVVSCSVGEDSVYLVVSDTFSVLKGVDLTLAMACLVKTIYGVTGIGTLHMKTENERLEGKDVVTMRIQDLFLMDESQLPADPE